MKKYLHPILLLTFSPLLLPSCVSKKKHLEAIAAYDDTITGLRSRLDTANNRIYRLDLDVSERKGENNALLAMQDKMLSRIVELDDEIERLQNESATRVESLDGRLQQKDAVIADKQGKIDALLATLNQRDQAMRELEQALRDTLKQVDSTVYAIEVANGQLSVALQLNFLFYPGSTNKTYSAGRDAIERISRVLSNYPTLEVLVVGHNDNTPLRRNSMDDKWEYSALQAATIVQLMTKKYELATSRVMLAAKGEFEPRASNATPEGRAKNERIEIRIFPSRERLIRDLRRRLE
ncbi:MAG: OmpA family protein [Lewinellaceae bacterium]|nr:OmpA family protein [Lewinellaceae bacterium]